jgi:hypothetical protein
MKISLVLPGGSLRAKLFHLGVISRLVRGDHSQDLIFLFTFSGGSLYAGSGYALNGFEWSKSQIFIQETKTLFSEFKNHNRVGEAIWSLRQSLLGKRNRLDLTYTPYCSIDLRLV